MTQITLPSHCSWFETASQILKTKDCKEVRVVRFNHVDDEPVLREWALRFRKHYCSDEDLAKLSEAMGMSPSDYLKEIKFPHRTTAPGPSIRSGDFSEILIADYIEFLMNYTVPRTRYDRKDIGNSSTKSVDIIGFKTEGLHSDKDELITCEVKATLTNQNLNALQEAIDHSKKDFETRLPFALNATYLRLQERAEIELANMLKRFMNKTADPYVEITGAALICSDDCWDDRIVTEVDASHPNKETVILVFVGTDLMGLAHRLYETAYVTA